MFAITPEIGVRTSVYLASSPKIEGVGGKYFANESQVESSAASKDEAMAGKLWSLGESLTGMSERGTP